MRGEGEKNERCEEEMRRRKYKRLYISQCLCAWFQVTEYFECCK